MKSNGIACTQVLTTAFLIALGLTVFSGTQRCLGFQDNPQAVVDGLSQKFESLSEQLTTLETKIDNADGDIKASQREYQDKLDDLTNTIEQLLEKCLVAIEADSGNQKNIQTVMGILLNEADKGDDRSVLMACDRLIAAGTHRAYFEYAAKAGRIRIEARELFDEALLRQREAKSDDLPRVLIKTNKGDITVELYENEAPQAVANFISLVESGFYNDSLFYSVIESFRAQTGGPTRENAKRQDPGYNIHCECYQPDARPHFTDVLSMAVKSKRDTGGSQFILALYRTSELDGKHTVFGRIIDGHLVTDQLVRTAIEINNEATDIPNSNPDHIISAKVLRKRDHKYTFRKVGEPEEQQPKPTAPPTQPETKSFDSEAADEDKEDAKSEDESADEKADESADEKSAETVDEAGEANDDDADGEDASEAASDEPEMTSSEDSQDAKDKTKDVDEAEDE